MFSHPKLLFWHFFFIHAVFKFFMHLLEFLIVYSYINRQKWLLALLLICCRSLTCPNHFHLPKPFKQALRAKTVAIFTGNKRHRHRKFFLSLTIHHRKYFCHYHHKKFFSLTIVTEKKNFFCYLPFSSVDF